ncbi:RsmB/NOP family class I SAM-dependent RNA methyltransferase [Candidatus Woesearchaeota archaeon]|nr:RsmB/NOP family class I SAM-dependent RNA methyltransferase [Candidatus Woesearchaeota archaeon]
MKSIPGTEDIEFKEKFVEQYSKLTNWDKFRQASLTFLSRAIRVNTLKGDISEVQKSIEKKGWKLKPIPWCKEGFWVTGPLVKEEGKERERRDVGNLLEHQLGKVYVQEAASMIPPLVLKAKPGELVLDMCAAPGSKTTQIAAMMKNEGLLIANDVSGMRLQSLGINLQRCGVTNALINLGTGFRFKEGNFDRILVDAPCSATGTIMRSLKTIRMWNPGMVKHLSKVQRRLLEVGFNNLKSGGTIVYSTCTLEPEEDEGVVSWLLENYSDAKIDEIKESELPGLKRGKAVLAFGKEKYNPEVKKCLRIWPQDNHTEGFFVTRIKKR